MSTIRYVIAHNRRDFNDAVDEITTHMTTHGYPGLRFAWVAGVHSLYGLSIRPDQVLFVDGWEARDDAVQLIRQLQQRMEVQPWITERVGL